MRSGEFDDAGPGYTRSKGRIQVSRGDKKRGRLPAARQGIVLGEREKSGARIEDRVDAASTKPSRENKE